MFISDPSQTSQSAQISQKQSERQLPQSDCDCGDNREGTLFSFSLYIITHTKKKKREREKKNIHLPLFLN